METEVSLPDSEKDILKEEEFILSAKDLVNHQVVPPVLQYRGPKDQHPDGSTRQEQQVLKRQEQRQALIKTQRVAKLGNLSVGEWEPDKELVVVKTHKGKFWHTMGYMLQGQKYLYPEEGLFLLEVGSMELLYGGVPLSIQRAYSLLIPTYLSKEHYRVYCHLMRLGYITTRHIECDITDYEYRLRMHQYRHTQNLAYHKVQGWFKQLGDEPMNSIWPDSDTNSLPSISPHSGRRRSKMSTVNSNSNTHSSNSVEQSGCDSSEVGSAGEMSQLMKARQKVHRAGGRASKQDKMKMVMTKENLRVHTNMASKDNQEQEGGLDEGEAKTKKNVEPVAMDTSEQPCEVLKKSPDPDVGAALKMVKICEFVEPMDPMDGCQEKCANAVKETSDESSVYSDGPVYPEDMDLGKGSVVEEMSISLLDFHKRRLNGSSEEGSKQNKRPKLNGSESDSSREKRSQHFPSPVAIPRPVTPALLAEKQTQNDSGKDTHSDLDQDFAKSDQQSRAGKRRLKQNYKMVLKQGKKPTERSLSSDLGLSDTASSTSVDLEEFLDMVVPILQSAQKGTNSSANVENFQTYLDYPHWNFDKIVLPDIASNVKTTHLPFPAKELVPESIAASRCDLETVEGKQAQLTQLCNNNKMLLAKSKKIINVLEHIGDGKVKTSDSKNPSTQTSKEPDNWKEYKEKQQQDEQNMTDLLTSPVSHLWNSDVKPLVKPADAKSTGHVLNKLQVIHGANLTSEHCAGQRFSPPLVDSKIAFDVFQPDKKYKKTNPGQPNLTVVVCSEEDPVPELATQLDLLMKAAPVPLVWAVVDNTDVNFYTLSDIELPVDITMG